MTWSAGQVVKINNSFLFDRFYNNFLANRSALIYESQAPKLNSNFPGAKFEL